MGVLLFSIAACFGDAHKLFELTSHFRLQYFVASLACSLIFLYFRAWPWAVAGLVCVAINGATLAPWYSRGTQVDPGQPVHDLRLLLANVHYANSQYSSLIQLVREEQPDLLIVEELTDQWLEGLKSLSQMFPYVETAPRDGGAGIALFSRLPLQESEAVFLIQQDQPSIAAKLSIGTATVSLLAVHPHTPLRRDHFAYRNDLLASATAFLKEQPPPKIVIGDFNNTLWSPYYARFEQETGMVNARKGFGLLPTWPTWMRMSLLMIPIDHCLVSPDIRITNFRTGRRIGSDHLPIIVDLAIPDSRRQKAVGSRQ